jgi:hypothetical protein
MEQIIENKLPSTIDTISEEWNVDVLNQSYQLNALHSKKQLGVLGHLNCLKSTRKGRAVGGSEQRVTSHARTKSHAMT